MKNIITKTAIAAALAIAVLSGLASLPAEAEAPMPRALPEIQIADLSEIPDGYDIEAAPVAYVYIDGLGA